jgi:hypothetical protein
MICVKSVAHPESFVVWLPEETRAVAGEKYAHLDEGQSGITRADINDEDIRTLGSFKLGDDVFVESEEPDDCLDDSDEQREKDTRIWWRVTLVAEP